MKKLSLHYSLHLTTFFIFSSLYSQNVGIGTSTPGARLHVVNGNSGHTGAYFPGFTLEGNIGVYMNFLTPAIEESGILFGPPFASYTAGIIFNNSTTVNGFQFRTSGNVTKMVIDQSGNVGIGTTSPVSPLSFASILGDKISLWGNSSINYGIGIQSGLLQLHTDGEFSDIAFGHGSSANLTERMRIMNTGFDGMSLNGRLVIKNGTTDFINGGGGVWFYKADNSALLGFVGAQNNQNVGFYGGTSNGGWGFVYNAINGRVGIGISTPQERLHVEGNTFIKDRLEVNGITRLFNNLVVEGASALHNTLDVDGVTQLNSSAYVNGLLGVGTTTPAFRLEVNGTAGKPGGGSWSATSDERLKENITPYTDGLSTLLKIKPVKYHYNQLSGYDRKPEYIGVLAQDMQVTAPYMVYSFQKNAQTYYSVDNSPMIYMLINAVKEQQEQIEELKKSIQQLLKK